MIYKTDRFDLIPFTKEHESEKYFSWFNNPKVTKYNSHGTFPKSRKTFDGFLIQIENKEILVWAILMKTDKNHIGNITLRSIDWINCSAELSVIVGESGWWNQGITTEAGKIVLKHGFEKLGLNRIWLGASSDNIGMCRAAKKIGMIQEGNSRDGIFLQGKFQDVICYSVLRREWDECSFFNK